MLSVLVADLSSPSPLPPLSILMIFSPSTPLAKITTVLSVPDGARSGVLPRTGRDAPVSNSDVGFVSKRRKASVFRTAVALFSLR